MAISKASKRTGHKGHAESAHVESHDEPTEELDEENHEEDDEDPTPVLRAGAKVTPTKQASDAAETKVAIHGIGRMQVTHAGATHVFLTRGIVNGQDYAPGDKVKLDKKNAEHLLKQGAIRPL